MITKLRQFIAALAVVLPSLASAQVANIPGIYLSGSAPAGFASQSFKMNCNNATPTSGQCWPLIEIYDAAGRQATINAGDGGLAVHVQNTYTPGQTTMSASSPVTMASDQSAIPVAPSTYPATAVPITASATGTTAATTATLTNVAGHLTYICGFSIRANATAAATGNATVTGVKTATMNFTQWTAPTASGLGVTEEIFAPCIPASAVSTSIAVISAAPGTGGVVSVTAWGYSI